MSNPSNWEIITYDLWADTEGGYSVNESFTTGRVYQFDNDGSDDDVFAALSADGYNVNDDNKEQYNIYGEYEVIWVERNGTPLVEFHLTEKPANC